MDRFKRKQVVVGGTLLALLLALGATQVLLEQAAAAQAKAATVQAPAFEVDPLWPKPMPNNWLLGQTIGLTVDDRDHVWIIHRGNDPGNLDRTEYATPTAGQGRVSECCDPAPPVLEFDAEGNLVGHWGGPGTGYEAGVEPRHGRRSQGLRLDRRQRTARRSGAEVHARRQVRGAVRQVEGAARSEVAGREARLHRQQQ
jgi:hypothetical protein